MRFSFNRNSVSPAPQHAAVLRVPERRESSQIEALGLKMGALIEAPLCPKGLIILCGQMGSISRDVQSWAEQMKAILMVVSDENLSLNWICDHAPRMDFLLVDADFMGDTESTVDFCMQIRRAAPALPLIMLSSEVRAHDFTCERMMACDATLKPPLMRSALTMGVQAAYQNNAYFQTARG